MPDVPGPGDSSAAGRPRLPPTAGLDGLKYRTAGEAALEPESPAAHRSVRLSRRGRHLPGQDVHGQSAPMFLAPCAIGGFFILLYAVTLKDRRLAKKDRSIWSFREFASTLYINCGGIPISPGLWSVASCSFWPTPSWLPARPITCWKRSAAPRPRYRSRYSLALTQSAVVVAAFLIGGKLSDRTGRGEIFVLTASIVYGAALFVIAVPATSTVFSSAWPSADSASAYTWLST
jgi:hypothetical protein